MLPDEGRNVSHVKDLNFGLGGKWAAPSLRLFIVTICD